MPANVRSFDAILLVRDELQRFTHRATDGIDELAGEIRRVIDWIEHDRPAYWKMRVRKAYDEVTEAKAALHRCLMYPINDQAPSCTEEKAALKKAEAHLRYCEAKQAKVREWARTLRHELHEYDGRMAKLRGLIELDTPRTIALLGRQTEALERYLSGSPGAVKPVAEPLESEGDTAAEEQPEGDAS